MRVANTNSCIFLLWDLCKHYVLNVISSHDFKEILPCKSQPLAPSAVEYLASFDPPFEADINRRRCGTIATRLIWVSASKRIGSTGAGHHCPSEGWLTRPSLARLDYYYGKVVAFFPRPVSASWCYFFGVGEVPV